MNKKNIFFGLNERVSKKKNLQLINKQNLFSLFPIKKVCIIMVMFIN